MKILDNKHFELFLKEKIWAIFQRRLFAVKTAV